MGLDQPPLGLFSAWLALAALMRGDEARFQRLARAPGMDDSALGLMLAMAASRQLRDARAGARAALALREQFPGVAADVPAALRRYALAPEIVARLLTVLQQDEPVAGR